MDDRIVVRGKTIDHQTRCEHYRLPEDVIAIRFKCCHEYYPCYQCHEEAAQHPALRWSKDEHDVKAILCGICQTELSIAAYLASNHQCPSCGAPFNPRCSLHHHLYFEV